MENNSKPPQSRQNNVVVQETESELLVYDLVINKAFCLNQTSAIVYQLCNGQNSVSEISRLLSRALQQPVSEEMVWLALDSLKKENLLEKADEFEIDFNGLNRRQVIKKVGLASMAALPVISSIVAPHSAYAQSPTNCPPIGTCIPAGEIICTPGCRLTATCDLYRAGSNCQGRRDTGQALLVCRLIPDGSPVGAWTLDDCLIVGYQR